jgi:hypothetical protein
MFIFLGWLGLSFIAGYIGSDRKIGFWGGFLLSVFLSPLIGFIVVALSKVSQQEEYEEEILQTQIQQQKTLERISEQTAAGTQLSISDEILKLKDLQERGILSEDEFETQKQKLLGI